LDAVTSWYLHELGDVDIRLVDSRDDVFNLAQCRNIGIEESAPDDVVIINDADTIPQREPLLAAVAAARSSGLVHLPYTTYHWLGPAGTRQAEAGVELAECDFELVHGACSGVYVTTPRTWTQHGGQDERFRGWGFEDAAWYIAHSTLLGEPPRRHEGAVFALHHEAQPREGAQYDANAALMERYRESSHHPDAMRQLVEGAAAANARALPGF
jgi:hypothetical protein